MKLSGAESSGWRGEKDLFAGAARANAPDSGNMVAVSAHNDCSVKGVVEGVL